MPRLLNSRFSIVFLLFGAAFLIYLATTLQNCSSDTAGKLGDLSESYLGDQACRSCHEEEYKDWLGSHHDLAMQEATEETVLGDFSGQSFTSNGVQTRFFKEDGKYMVNAEGPDGEYQDFEVRYTFGVEPLQQYLLQFPGGRLQCLLIAWDTEKKEWFDLVPGQRPATDDWLHWTKGSMTWNTMCADCHSTYLQKNYDEQTDTYDTQWAIIDVSCEACHGPGREHQIYINSSAYQRGERVEGSYTHLTASLTNKQQVDECARCHARRGQATAVFDHSGGFMDHYIPEILRPGLYHLDGQILDEVYVYGSFLQSKMYHNNVRCTDCHNAHSLELKAVGNALCGQCHLKEQYDVKEHHFHARETEGAQCVNCHMPGKYYMGNDFRRDHSFRIPRPDLSVRYGTPDACNQCHKDKSEEWAAKAIENWYGTERQPHFSPALAAAQSGDIQAIPGLMEMVGDTSYSAIVQATAVNLFGEMPAPETNQKIIEALQNGNPLIRYSAVSAMGRFSTEDRLRYLSPLLSDSVRTIRTHTAYMLADLDEALFYGDSQKALQSAKKEFEETLKIQADFPSGQLMRGQYYHKMKELDLAKQAYQEAIRQDPYLPQPYFNLANLHYGQNNLQSAQANFEKAIQADSNSVEAHYALGLLLAEMKKLSEAAPYLGKAAQLSGYPRYYYNWGLTLQNLNQPDKAEQAFRRGLQIDPENEALLYALAVLFIQQQRVGEAQPVVQHLLEVNPQNSDYQGLLRAVR